jgi:hypothetical protein
MSRTIYEFTQLPEASTAMEGVCVPDELRAPDAIPRVGVIYNPRSHRNKGQDLDCDISPHIFIAQPGERDQLPSALCELAKSGIDLLVINGGDGTVRDVLTCGVSVFGDNWPAIAVLPKGKTNALTVDLDAPADWSLQGAIDAFQNGRRIRRQPMKVTNAQSPDASVLGFIMGAGAFTLGTRAGQSAHKLGAFNSLAVGVTTAWGILQAFLGSKKNPWRQGVKIDLLADAQRAPFPHSGNGDAERRQFLLASTLGRFPAGIKPFGNLGVGLKLAVLDQIKRRTLPFLLGAIVGREIPRLSERGFHQTSISRFELDIDDQIILDGEAFPAGRYIVEPGPELEFVAP